MKRKILILFLSLLALLVLLVFAGGPLLVKLGVPPFAIQTDNQGGIRLARMEFTPTAQPALQPGNPPVLAPNAQPVIIDTDMAPDDWLAILYLLQRSDVDVKAITISARN